MKNSGLLIAAVVLAVLSGVLYWSNRHPASQNTAKASIDTPPKILALKQEDISKIEIKKKGGEAVDLAKTSAGKWEITVPKPLGADQESVSSLLSSVSTLNSERLVDDKPTDLTQYGLAQPALEIGLTTKDAKPQKLLVGDDTPVGNAVFAKLDGDPRVFTIASYNKSSLDKSANDFRNKKLFDFGFDEPGKVELHDGAKAYFFTKGGQDWWSGDSKKLDSATVQPLIDKIRELSASKFVDSGFTSPALQVSVVSNDGKRVA